MTGPRVINYRRDNVAAYAPGAVRITRPSIWGNPFRIGYDGSRAEVIAKYRAYLELRPALKALARIELRGKNLVCCCAPLVCHGDVLLEIANA